MIDCRNALFPTTSASPFRTKMCGNNFFCGYIMITTTIFTVHRVMLEIKTFVTMEPFWNHVLITSLFKLVIVRVAQQVVHLGQLAPQRGALGVHDQLLCPEICHRSAALSNETTPAKRVAVGRAPTRSHLQPVTLHGQLPLYPQKIGHGPLLKRN